MGDVYGIISRRKCKCRNEMARLLKGIIIMMVAIQLVREHAAGRLIGEWRW